MDRDLDGVDIVPRKLWQRQWFWIAALLLALASACLWCFLDIPGFVKGDTDIFGEYRFRQDAQQQRDAMTTIERVHAELFPRWLIAEATQLASAPQDFAALYDAVEDPQLKAVLDDLSSAIASGMILAPPRSDEPDVGAEVADVSTEVEVEVAPPPELNPLHIDLLRRWNDRLEQLGEAFYVTGSISMTSTGPALISEFYVRLADPVVKVGDREITTLILQRIDRTNIVEAYLGVARRGDVALVVTDRILELATDRIWLMLNPDTTSTDPLDAAYAEAVRAEVAAGLGADTTAVLRRTAVDRKRLLDAVDEALARAKCGSTMQFGLIRWDGFDPATLDRLDAYAERDRIMPCPTMKASEAATIRASSRALQSEETKVALERLVAWLTRMIALHEARHTADEQVNNQHEDPASCPGCPVRLSRAARAELSAYVASFAWSTSPATAMYQACTAAFGAHGRAMRVINRELDRACTDPPPEDLAKRATDLQKKLFGAAPSMALPADYPDQLVIHRFR